MEVGHSGWRKHGGLTRAAAAQSPNEEVGFMSHGKAPHADTGLRLIRLTMWAGVIISFALVALAAAGYA